MASLAEKRADVARGPRHSTHTVFGSMMRSAGVATLIVLVASVVAALASGSQTPLVSVVAGVLVAAAFFAMGALGLRTILAGPTSGALTGALAIYIIQIAGLLAVLLVAPVDLVPDPRWFGGGALVEAVAWQGAQVRVLRRARVLAFPGIEMPAPSHGKGEQ